MARNTPARSTKSKKSLATPQPSASTASIASVASTTSTTKAATPGLPRSPTKAAVSSLRPGLGTGASAGSLAAGLGKGGSGASLARTGAGKPKRIKHSSDDPETSSVAEDGEDESAESATDGERTPVKAWQRPGFGFGALALDETDAEEDEPHSIVMSSPATTVDEVEADEVDGKRQNVVVCLR